MPASTKVLRQKLKMVSRERVREVGHRLSCKLRRLDFTLRALASHLRWCVCVCVKILIKFNMLTIFSV